MFIQICHAVSVVMFIYQIDTTSDTIAFKMTRNKSTNTKKRTPGKKNPESLQANGKKSSNI